MFFVAGAIHTATHKTEVSQLNGIGRAMPFTMSAFFIGALSIIGLPPLVGTWSKLFIARGGLDGDYGFVVAALMISSVLNVAYLMPIVVRAFFAAPAKDEDFSGIKEAPWFCVVPLCFTALACLALFFVLGDLEAFLGGIMGVDSG